MNNKSLAPLKGFSDRYPQDMAILNYLIDTVKSVAFLCGFQQYDGPLVEPMELYIGKTSQEILEEQSFTLSDKKGNTLMLRPEMTPSLARMVAAKSQDLPLPIRYFNVGLRYRYEAPQRGRNREFYQIDFDIIGSSSEIADIEILYVLAQIFTKLGATENDFVIYLNSRSIMTEELRSYGISDNLLPALFAAIDKRDKTTDEEFVSLLAEVGIDNKQRDSVVSLMKNPAEYTQKFDSIIEKARIYGIDSYLEVNPMIVRGLNYYTGLVFEVKSKGTLRRSLLGGGRYDNLVGMFGAGQNLPGVGFALSDTIMIEFLNEIGAMPIIQTSNTSVLVTLFDESTQNESLQLAAELRKNGITCEVYPDNAKLQKQLAYANKTGIPFVLVLGPDESKNKTVTLKNMQSGEQESVSQSEIAAVIISLQA